MLRIEEIRKEFNDKAALAGVSLSFPEKGMVIIKGESGSGKTTLLNIITGNDFPTSGKIEYNGVAVTYKNAEKYRTQYCSNIYQDYMLIEDLTVKENIELALQVIGQDYTVDDIISLIEKVGLPKEYIGKKVIKMSGGEKQRVAIARAIAKNDAMIFADEPTGNLDNANGCLIMDLLKEISAERLVIVVSHNENFNAKYADYTIELIDGKVAFCNLPDEQEQNSAAEEKKEETLLKKRCKNLKAKTVARLAFWGFEKNRVKSVLAIVAFVIFCMLSTLLMTLAFANHHLALAKTLDGADQKNVMLIPGESVESEEIEKYCANASYKSSQVYNFSFKATSFGAPVGTEEEIKYAIIYDEEVGADAELFYGEFPKKTNEIALPHNFALCMTQYCEEFISDSVETLVGKVILYKGCYPFKISGIFDEGRSADDYEQLSEKEKIYIAATNFMAQSVFLSKDGLEILNKNEYLFERTPAEIYISMVNGDRFDSFGYDEYADYSLENPALEKGQVYLCGGYAAGLDLEAGDRVTIDIGYNEIKSNGRVTFVKFGSLTNLYVKGVITKVPYGGIIYSEEDFEEFILPKGQNKYNVEALYFNAKDIGSSYFFFNTIGKEGGDIFNESASNPNMNVMLQNMLSVNQVYKYVIFYQRITVPLAIILFAGTMIMCAVSTMYLMASKGNSYNILRAIGCGKRNIAFVLLLQLFTMLTIGLILGFVLGSVMCTEISDIVLTKTIGLSGGIVTERLFVVGAMPVVIIMSVTILQTLASVAIKIKYMFSKSIMDYKTK